MKGLGLIDKVLDDGLDELAANAHNGMILRMVMAAAVSVLAFPTLGLTPAAAWFSTILAGETWAFFATRRQARGERVGRRLRVNYLATLLLVSLNWMVMGWMFWRSGTPTGMACGVALWTSVIFFSQTHAYRTPTGGVVGGVIPALAMMSVVPFSPGLAPSALIPIVAILGLSCLFAGDGVMRMVKERKRLDDAQARLAESEAQYRVLADNVSDVIALTKLGGERVFISPSITKAMGFTPEELLSTQNYTYLYPEDAERVVGEIAAMGETRQDFTTEYRVVHRDGHVLWVETGFTVVDGTAADPRPQVISVSRNIDVRKAMERDLIEARERAEQAAAAKSDFLANMTHELRTPLNAIVGFSGLLKGSDRLGPEDARHSALIHDASQTLLELVNSVLDFSRLEAGAVEVDPHPFCPVTAARAAAALLTEQATAKGLTLDVIAEGADGEWLMGDASRIKQVLLNFLSNAVKFTATGGVTLNVRVAGEDTETRRLRLEIADTGIGMTPDQLSQVFERFTQADVSVSRRFGGTGLGLSICKRIVELMGGRIGAESREGAGSTFWIELDLPVAESREGALELDAEAAELDRPIRLLLVEDVAVNRELVQTLLRPFDVVIDMAVDGVQAVEAMETGGYDLILMDVQMPVMDGLTAARRIRAMPGADARETPIIAMTANVLPEQIEKCLAAGMDDHIGKPVSPARLLEALSFWSGRRRQAPANERVTA